MVAPPSSEGFLAEVFRCFLGRKVNVNGVNLIGDAIRRIERNADVLLNACWFSSKHREN